MLQIRFFLKNLVKKNLIKIFCGWEMRRLKKRKRGYKIEEELR